MNRLLRLAIFSFYVLFALFNTLIFSVGLFSDFWGYFSDKAGFVIHISGLIFPLIAVYPVAYTFTNIKAGKSLLVFFREAYLWCWTLLLVAVIVSTSFDIKKWTFYDYLTTTTMLLSLLIMYSYFRRKQFFNRAFWKIYLWFSIAWGLIETVYWTGDLDRYFSLPDYLKSFNPPSDIPAAGYIIFCAFLIPAYYPHFKIAYDKHFFDKSR